MKGMIMKWIGNLSFPPLVAVSKGCINNVQQNTLTQAWLILISYQKLKVLKANS